MPLPPAFPALKPKKTYGGRLCERLSSTQSIFWNFTLWTARSCHIKCSGFPHGYVDYPNQHRSSSDKPMPKESPSAALRNATTSPKSPSGQQSRKPNAADPAPNNRNIAKHCTPQRSAVLFLLFLQSSNRNTRYLQLFFRLCRKRIFMLYFSGNHVSA